MKILPNVQKRDRLNFDSLIIYLIFFKNVIVYNTIKG